MPDAETILGGLSPEHRAEVASVAQRITDAVTVRRIGTPFDISEGVSQVKQHVESQLMLWYQEDYRDDVVLILRAQHFGAAG